MRLIVIMNKLIYFSFFALAISCGAASDSGSTGSTGSSGSSGSSGGTGFAASDRDGRRERRRRGHHQKGRHARDRPAVDEAWAARASERTKRNGDETKRNELKIL